MCFRGAYVSISHVVTALRSVIAGELETLEANSFRTGSRGADKQSICRLIG